MSRSVTSTVNDTGVHVHKDLITTCLHTHTSACEVMSFA